jgi:AmmeMemoRadiSam system protein A
VRRTSASVLFEHEVDGRCGGAFVTLHDGAQLRGCIGHIEAHERLSKVVARCAIAACSADPRFPAVSEVEVDRLSIELSLLGPIEAIDGIEEIEIGRHGLMIEKGRFRGLLLPQVAIEWQWGPQQFLEHTCRKAGLPPDAWKFHATLWRFEAEVFRETSGPPLQLPR